MVRTLSTSLLLIVCACGSSSDPNGLEATAGDDVLVPGTPGRPPAERVAVQPRRAVPRAHTPEVEDSAAAPEAEEEAGQRIVIDGPGLSPLLGRDLAETAKGMKRYDATMGEGTGLGSRGNSLAHSGGQVEAIEIEAPTGDRPPPGAITGHPSSWPSLSMPPRKACLAVQAAEISESGEGRSGGLSVSAFRRGINSVATKAYGCFPSSTSGTVRATAWVVAGCDGRVARVEVDPIEGVAAEIQACITHTLEHASFPAHGLPDGQEAMVPLTFRL